MFYGQKLQTLQFRHVIVERAVIEKANVIVMYCHAMCCFNSVLSVVIVLFYTKHCRERVQLLNKNIKLCNNICRTGYTTWSMDMISICYFCICRLHQLYKQTHIYCSPHRELCGSIFDTDKRQLRLSTTWGNREQKFASIALKAI